MKYLILRKRPDAGDDLFMEMVSASARDDDFQFPFEVESQELEDNDVGDLRRDPNVEELVLSIPFTLIEPVDEPSAEPASQTDWGIEAVGAASSPQDGDGVTIAVLDTGIDDTHPGFSGVALELMDFTANERGVANGQADGWVHLRRAVR